MSSLSENKVRSHYLQFLSRGEILAAVCLIGFFLFLVCYRLHAPALIWDNLSDEKMGAEWAESLRQTGTLPAAFFRGYPLYHGQLTTYLMFPVFLIFGPSYAAVKLMSVMFAVLTLIFSWLFVREAFSRKAALISLFLLVIHTSFVGGTYIGSKQVSSMLFFSIGSLYFLYRWWKGESSWNIVLGLFLAGLGMGTRLWFASYVVGIVVTALIFGRDVLKRFAAERNGFRAAVYGLVAFGAGLLPIVVYEFSSGFSSSKQILDLYQASVHSPRAFSVVANVSILWRGLSSILSGRWVGNVQFFFHECFQGHNITLRVFIAALLSGIYPCIDRKLRPLYGKRWAGLFVLFVIIIGMSLLNPSVKDLRMGPYLYVIYPFPQILIGIAFAWWFDFLNGKKLILLPMLVFGLLILGEVWALGLYMNGVRMFGGMWMYSQATEGLSGWLKTQPAKIDATVVGHRQLRENLYFWNPQLPLISLEHFVLSASREEETRAYVEWWQREVRSVGYRDLPHPLDADGPAPLTNPERDFFPQWEREIQDRGYKNLYLVRVVHPVSIGLPYVELPIDLVMYWAVHRKRPLKLQARFFEGDGRPMYEVYLIQVAD